MINIWPNFNYIFLILESILKKKKKKKKKKKILILEIKNQGKVIAVCRECF